jgi:hypothetical protein
MYKYRTFDNCLQKNIGIISIKNKIMRKNHLLKIFVLLVAVVVLSSWGGTGHYKINNSAALSFNTEMSQFLTWSSLLADHASDADYRKSEDPTEAPKHYIDIDNYSEFVSSGEISQSIEDAISIHGYDFVYDNGILPWAAKASYDSLKNCFLRRDWDKAMLFASDLGHYIADSHMPLHITANYNGQLTDNYGIHSRYESTMINSYISQITYTGETISVIPNVDQYIFDCIYSNYQYVDSVIAADTYAKSLSGGDYNSTYYNALWLKTKNFTTKLFKNGSHSLAELIYTAWKEAGSPSMSEFIYEMNRGKNIIGISPNPSRNTVNIQYEISYESDVLIQVKNISGILVDTVSDEQQTAGTYVKTWNVSNCEQGIYFIVVSTEKEISTKMLMIIK